MTAFHNVVKHKGAREVPGSNERRVNIFVGEESVCRDLEGERPWMM